MVTTPVFGRPVGKVSFPLLFDITVRPAGLTVVNAEVVGSCEAVFCVAVPVAVEVLVVCLAVFVLAVEVDMLPVFLVVVDFFVIRVVPVEVFEVPAFVTVLVDWVEPQE